MSEIDKLEWENVTITSVFLGREGHGILTASLMCQGEVFNQSFGGRSLETPGALKNFVLGTLEACEVESWDQLPGKVIRIGRTERRGPILAIRPLVNSWPVFMPTNELTDDPCLHRGPQ